MLCYNFRILNNEYGRWISRDLLEEFDGNNLYIFITNSPIINYDYEYFNAINIIILTLNGNI